MDNKDFVPFETAKKLKDAGFNGICRSVWHFDGEQASFIEDYPATFHGEPSNFNNSNVFGLYVYSAPTLWQTAKWLREVKGIDITISVYREIDETVSPRIIKRSYECEITTEDDEDYIAYNEDEKNFPSYEAALSAGIDAAPELITTKTE